MEQDSHFPIDFNVIEMTPEYKLNKVYIGNIGGKYTWQDNWDYFEQHFTPDTYFDSPEEPDLQRKFATLYPAILYKFIEWQSSLPDNDRRKDFSLIKGWTNIRMSNFRARLLGDSYSWRYLKDEENMGEPTILYEINLTKLKANKDLLTRLKRFAKRAESMNYTTTSTIENR